MNYRGRQIRDMWAKDVAKKSQAWQEEKQILQQDIVNLQNSTDLQILTQTQQENQRLNQGLNSILKKWSWDGQNPQSAEEFLNKFTPWVNEQIENKKTWTKQIQELKAEVKDKDRLKEKLIFYTDNLKTKESIISEYQAEIKEKEQKETELSQNLTLQASKITSLETQLLTLAQQKLTKQKQAQALVQQLEVQWKDKQKDWQEQTQAQQDRAAQLLAQTKAEHQKQLKSLKQKAQQEQAQAVRQTNQAGETKLKELKENLETKISSLELKLEVSSRELEEKQTKISELQEWSEGQHERILELEAQEQNFLIQRQEKENELTNEKTARTQAETELNHLQNRRPNLKEHYLVSINYLKTKAQEFITWLNADPVRKANLTEWEKVMVGVEKAKQEAIDNDFKNMEILSVKNAEDLLLNEFSTADRERYRAILKNWTIDQGLFTTAEWEERERETGGATSIN